MFIINNKIRDKSCNDLFKSLVVLSCLTISLKPFYLIYLFLIFYFIFDKKIRYYLMDFIKSKLLIFVLIYISFSILVTFFNSSCLIFPAEFTCFENLPWSISKQEVSDVRVWYELWSKAGATPNYVVENRIDYISNFNWFVNWVNNYFFNKFSDYLLSLIVIGIIIFSFFKFGNGLKINDQKRKYKILYGYIIFFTAEWFFNHPALRYGGYHLFALLIFIP